MSDVGTENRYVVFDLPFPLRIRDSVAGAEQQTAPFFVGTAPPCEIATLLVMSATGVQGMRGKGELEGGDPYGRWSHTRVQVRFHCLTSSEVRQWEDSVLVARAMSAANTLIAHYRDLGNQPLLRELSMLDVVHFKIVEEFGQDKSREHWYSTGRQALVFGVNDERRRMEDVLRQRVQAATPVAFLRQLELDVLAHAESGDYRLAVIEMATLFESWLRRYIVIVLAERGHSQADINRRFVRQNGRFMSVTEIARTIVPEVFAFDFLNSQPGRDWQLSVRDLRNELVHGSCETVTKEDATRALSAGHAARNIIIQHARRPEA